MVAERVEPAVQSGEWTRRGWLVRAGTSAAAAGALSLAGPASAALAAPAEQLLGSTLRLNMGIEPNTIDPQVASFVGEIGVIMRVFRNLMTFDKNIQLIPDQAADFPLVEENGTKLTFTLKPGLTYSDGRTLTAHDFEFGWKRHLDPTVAGDYAFTGYILAGAEDYSSADTKTRTPEQLRALRDAVGVKALDDRTLQFRLTAAAPWFMSVLATWCGVPSREDMVTRGGQNWTEPATYIGNGPYVLASWEHQNRMRFTANAGYHSGPPPISSIESAMIQEGAVAFAAYLNDELDLTGVAVEDRGRIDADPDLKLQFRQYAGSCTYYVGFNNALAPFDNPKVRSAFSFGLDRTSFVRNILGGQGLPARQFVPPDFPGHYDFELEEQTFNPNVAQRLLAEAGFPNARGLPALKWTYGANARTKTRIEALTSQLKATLNVDITLDPVEATAYTALLKKPETTPQLFLLGWCQDYPDPQNWYSTVFHSKSTITHVNWKNAEFDRLTEAADREFDLARRRDQYRQAAQVLINDVPVAFLYNNVAWVLVKPRVQGFREDPLEYFLGEHDLYNLKLS